MDLADTIAAQVAQQVRAHLANGTKLDDVAQTDWQGEVDRLRRELEDMRVERGYYVTQHKDDQAYNQNLHAKINQQEATISESFEVADRLRGQLEHMQNTASSYKTDADNLRHELAGLTADLSRTRNDAQLTADTIERAFAAGQNAAEHEQCPWVSDSLPGHWWISGHLIALTQYHQAVAAAKFQRDAEIATLDIKREIRKNDNLLNQAHKWKQVAESRTNRLDTYTLYSAGMQAAYADGETGSTTPCPHIRYSLACAWWKRGYAMVDTERRNEQLRLELAATNARENACHVELAAAKDTANIINEAYIDGRHAAELEWQSKQETKNPFTESMRCSWWNRGYQTLWRMLLSIKAEQARDKARQQAALWKKAAKRRRRDV